MLNISERVFSENNLENITNKSLWRQFRDQMISSVGVFRLRPDLLGSPGHEDVLFVAIRTFYLLLPNEGLRETWCERPKHVRRVTVRQHLEAVCADSTVDARAIDTVDRWLTTIGSTRNQLGIYGRQVEERFGSICFICGRQISEGKSIDHVLPLSRGGTDEIANYRLAHKSCNSSKNNLMIGDQLVWAPANLRTEVEAVPHRLRYFVFLRDDFKCTDSGCCRGLDTGDEICLTNRFGTGIACYDNLRTQCVGCHNKTKGGKK